MCIVQCSWHTGFSFYPGCVGCSSSVIFVMATSIAVVLVIVVPVDVADAVSVSYSRGQISSRSTGRSLVAVVVDSVIMLAFVIIISVAINIKVA